MMIPRGSLDLEYSEILSGIYHCFSASPNQAPTPSHELFCLSVRSGFDLILQGLQLPFGSEILITEVNIPGIFEIIEAHGLVGVPLPIGRDSLMVSEQDLVRAISPLSRIVVFTHLFGAIAEIDGLVKIAKERGLTVVEDCAQAFDGKYFGNTSTDIAMFSFGMIKTNTALGGALLKFKDREIQELVARLQEQLPVQEKKRFFKKLMIALLIKTITIRLLYSVFYCILKLIKKDPDQVLSGFTRGFPGKDILSKIRYRPCTALKFLLERKLNRFSEERLSSRASYGAQISTNIPHGMRIGGGCTRHSFWVMPVESEDAEGLVITFRVNGFDATMKASSLIKCASGNARTEDAHYLNLEKLVYLPMYPKMTDSEMRKMITILNKSF